MLKKNNKYDSIFPDSFCLYGCCSFNWHWHSDLLTVRTGQLLCDYKCFVWAIALTIGSFTLCSLISFYVYKFHSFLFSNSQSYWPEHIAILLMQLKSYFTNIQDISRWKIDTSWTIDFFLPIDRRKNVYFEFSIFVCGFLNRILQVLLTILLLILETHTFCKCMYEYVSMWARFFLI